MQTHPRILGLLVFSTGSFAFLALVIRSCFFLLFLWALDGFRALLVRHCVGTKNFHGFREGFVELFKFALGHWRFNDFFKALDQLAKNFGVFGNSIRHFLITLTKNLFGISKGCTTTWEAVVLVTIVAMFAIVHKNHAIKRI